MGEIIKSIAHGVFDGEFGGPAKLFFGFGGVGINFGEVARAARGNFVWEWLTAGLLESVDHFHHGGGGAGAEGVDGNAFL